MFHKHDSVTDDTLKVTGIAALAAAIGAAVAMLFTPRTGGQVRRGLGRRAHHLKDEISDHFQTAEDDVTTIAKDAATRAQSTASKVADDARSTAKKVKQDAKTTSTRTRTTAKRATKPATTRSDTK